ncbi:hypothetical protein BaRGS_00003784, partial [Batillaria attramentaria]
KPLEPSGVLKLERCQTSNLLVNPAALRSPHLPYEDLPWNHQAVFDNLSLNPSPQFRPTRILGPDSVPVIEKSVGDIGPGRRRERDLGLFAQFDSPIALVPRFWPSVTLLGPSDCFTATQTRRPRIDSEAGDSSRGPRLIASSSMRGSRMSASQTYSFPADQSQLLQVD